MENTLCCKLDDRALICVEGDDARSFIQGLVTCDVDTLKTGELAFGALLSPQGKILFDFFLLASLEGFIVDIDRSMADDLIKKLTFYKLRSKVEIRPLGIKTKIFAIWQDDTGLRNVAANGLLITDPRLSRMGMRAYIRDTPTNVRFASLEDWHEHRIGLGMPHGGIDFTFGDAFPHDALMDQFDGVNFQKGCFIGQEVVSRMQHRGTARKRILKVSALNPLPASDTDIMVDGKPCGKLASTSGTNGLAVVRLDRVGDENKRASVTVGAIEVKLSIPDWCRFGWPEDKK